MAETRITMRHTGEGHGIEGVSPNGSLLLFDGETGNAGPTPMQHLLAAAGACALMDVGVILRKKRLVFDGLQVECIGERPDEGHPKPFTSIRLVFSVEGDVPLKTLEDAVRLALDKYCNVAATLRAGVVPTFEAHVRSPGGPHSSIPTSPAR